MSKQIFYWVKKRTCWGVLDIEEIRDKNNETGLKEGGGIEMSIYSAPFAMLAPFAYLPSYCHPQYNRKRNRSLNASSRRLVLKWSLCCSPRHGQRLNFSRSHWNVRNRYQSQSRHGLWQCQLRNYQHHPMRLILKQYPSIYKMQTKII